MPACRSSPLASSDEAAAADRLADVGHLLLDLGSIPLIWIGALMPLE